MSANKINSINRVKDLCRTVTDTHTHIHAWRKELIGLLDLYD